MKIVIIGAGNLATHMTKALKEAGEEVVMIYSRSEESASALGEKTGIPYTTDLSLLPDDADLYIFAVKDSALESVLSSVKPNSGIWAHTAGSVDMNIFKDYSERGAVYYPLQTFSKEKEVNYREIPVCVEAVRKEDEAILMSLASKLSDHPEKVTSEQRKYLHLSAVFACNFTNHMYDIASVILKENNLSFDIIRPLIKETCDKIMTLSPREAQTGPAVRYDENIINRQTGLLEDPVLKDIYKLLSKNINNYSKKK